MPVHSRLFRAVALAVTLAVLLPAQPAAACSCAMGDAPSTAFAQATAVFEGRVTAIVDQRQVLGWLDRLRQWFGVRGSLLMYGYLVTLDVTTAWKGVAATPVTLETGYGGGDCGYSFTVGDAYLVYAYGQGNDLGTHICSRTTHIMHAGTDLAYLNTQPTLPVSQVVPWRTALLVCVPAALAVLALAAAVLVLRRVRARSPAA